MAIWSEITRSISTFKNLLRRGRDTRLDEISSHTFEDVATNPDDDILKNVTFENLTETVWTKENRN